MAEIHVGFVVDEVALRWGFLGVLLLPLSVSFMFIACLAEDGQLANQRPHFYRYIAQTHHKNRLPLYEDNFRA